MKINKLIYFLALLSILGSTRAQAEPTNTCQTEVYFSHSENLEQKLIQLINNENLSIQIAVYQLKARSILDALIQAKQRGVTITIITDPKIIPDMLPIYNFIKENHLDIYLWKCKKPFYVKNESTFKKIVPKLHNKFILFGSDKVWTGSCNFSKTAFTINAENALLISCPFIVQKYQKAFGELLRESYPYEIEKRSF
ncbi:MAG: DUF1669 domain-containing protein [Chlamydiae bacterium]|nr:DUF1669 domain-containing protein [Chlamydiota bacterium]